MNKPFFSVVMPAYGVEKYLEKAVESIEAQTFSQWELLIVEDGSPDKTGELAEMLAEKDQRIRVFHHEKNKGLSPARNTGMSQAKGQYIWFMDPDDYVEASVLEEVYKALQENPAELTIIGHKEEYYDRDGKLNYTHEIRPRRQFFFQSAEDERTRYLSGTGNYIRICLEQVLQPGAHTKRKAAV